MALVRVDSQGSSQSGWWIMVLFTKMDKISGELSLLEIVKTLALAMVSLRGLLYIHQGCQVESGYLSLEFLKGKETLLL